VLSTVAQVYLFNGITKFTSTWFDQRSRSVATAVIILFGHLGQYTVVWISKTYDSMHPPFEINDGKTLYEVLDQFKLVMVIINVVLTIAIISLFESKPLDTYPTKSQKYFRSKMYEPHLDVKYLLQYQSFKYYALACALLMTIINSVPEVQDSFSLVEFQVSDAVQNIAYIWGPLVFIGGLFVSSLVLVFFSQTNAGYKGYFLLLLAVFIASLVLAMLGFLSASASFYGIAYLLQMAVMGAMKLFIFEFITEIIFPVSPVFGLGILNGISGILSLFVSMFSLEVLIGDPLNTSFVYVVQLFGIAVCLFAGYVFIRIPYKLNRTDYDFDRRQTMVASYGRGDYTSINRQMDERLSADQEGSA
jgi:hypothetical protein